MPDPSAPEIWALGARHAHALDRHYAFYHAIAVENSDAVLVTIDERYLRAAQGKGRIMHYERVEIATVILDLLAFPAKRSAVTRA